MKCSRICSVSMLPCEFSVRSIIYTFLNSLGPEKTEKICLHFLKISQFEDQN